METKEIRLEVESRDYLLYKKERHNSEWFNFILVLKKPKTTKTRFEIGWNGVRFSSSADQKMLSSIDQIAIRWLSEILTTNYRKIDKKIEEIATDLQIPYLVHFTNEKNLESILQIGVHPISNSKKYNFTPVANDILRLDGHPNSVSLSIGYPNWKMLFKYRKQFTQDHWAILLIEKSVLWTKKCAFCKHNAADSRISKKSIEELTTHHSLMEMFEDLPEPKSRKEQRLHTYDPTDVQAEVLVFDFIHPSLINEIVFDSPDVANKYIDIASGARLSYEFPNQGFFSSRNFAR